MLRRIGLAAALYALSTAAMAAPAMEAESGMGKILVNEKGMTLYTFDKDEMDKTNCYEKCAVNWPPLMAADGAAAEGDWTLVERTDGGKMWAYKGHPLYLWVKDQNPGETTGDGVGGVWHVAKP
ncbi:MAG: COG4315 family predicted lipoprotein [Propylenella sp.]